MEAGNVYCWPLGHTVCFELNTKFVEFSPEKEFREVIDHVQQQSSGYVWL